MILEQGLAKAQYQKLRDGAKMRNAPHLYPSYNDVRHYKKECRPLNISVSDRVCSVDMNSSLNHFLDRLLQIPSILERVLIFTQDSKYYVFMITKYGGDGFATQVFYKGLHFFQKNIFAVTCVPVMIKALDKTTNKSYVVWVNSRANSAFACRPLHYEFMKEDKKNSSALGKKFMEQAKNLSPYTGIGISIGHDPFATLLDGLYYFLTIHS